MRYNTYSMQKVAEQAKADPGGVTEGSQGVGVLLSLSENDTETPGKFVTVFSPRPSSAPVVTTATFYLEGSSTE